MKKQNRELEVFMDKLAQKFDFNGTVLVGKEGTIQLKKPYGLANREHDIPHSVESKFIIGSITKTFTAVAVMILVERGLLNIEAPISNYLPNYPNGDIITIHHLLAHTSGISSLNKSEAQSIMRLSMTPEEIIEKTFKHKPLLFAPGEKYAYSNSGYILLAHLIEVVSGHSYENFLIDHIFHPLNMNDTGTGDHTKILKHRASGYEYVNKQLRNGEFFDISFRVGCGNLYSTIEDLFLWDQAFYSEKLISLSTMEQMFTSHSEGDYGYGWEVENEQNTKRIGHTGGSIGFFTDFSRYVEEELVIIVLSNVTLTPVTEIRYHLRKFIADQGVDA